jgi:putative thiamine transport system substrate-binding protein
MPLSRRHFLAASLISPFASPAWAGNWEEMLAAARGQTVRFNAWAGSETINAYIGWVAEQVKALHGITLTHVKITDAAEVVRRVRDEVSAGAGGSVDLIWINGENFLAMKKGKLLFGPFAEALPNFKLVDTAGKPTTMVDFAEPTDGLESPWGMAQLTFFGDGAKISMPPASLAELAEFAKNNPGRVTYPAPPDFHGTTFLKQVLIETMADRSPLGLPATQAAFETVSGAFFTTLDALHPSLWREGKQFPQSQAQVKQMLADGELLMALTFNPNEPANLVATGELPPSTIAWQHAGGTVGNTHFVAIPINSAAQAAAQVVANFLLSPEAQGRKADLKVWGDPTVLNLAAVSPEERKLFPPADAPGAVKATAAAIPEPHGSWVPLIEAAWITRYGS